MIKIDNANITAEKWIRAKVITVDNPYLADPSITFDQEIVTMMGPDEYFVRDVGSLHERMVATGEDANLNEVFTLVHPVTGDELGSATYGQIQVMLFSLYLHLIDKASQGEPEPPAPEPPAPEPPAPEPPAPEPPAP